MQEAETLKLLLEVKLEAEDKSKTRQEETAPFDPDLGKDFEAVSLQENEDGDTAHDTAGTSENKILPTSEYGKQNFAGTIPNKEELPSSQGARPNSQQQQENAATIENLQTFSKQKLALLQCDYDPEKCTYCGKSKNDLKQCTKCKTAKYCSKECQAKSWDEKHKADCKEMRRLQKIIQKEENKKRSVTNLSLPAEEVSLLALDTHYFKLSFRDGKMLFHFSRSILPPFIATHNPKTLEVEQFVCSTIVFGVKCFGLEVLEINHQKYVTVFTGIGGLSFIRTPMPNYKIDVWSLENQSKKPFYTFQSNIQMYEYGPMCLVDDNLLVVNNGSPIKYIVEIDASSIPFKETGHVIPVTGMDEVGGIENMCAMKQGHDRRLIIQYSEGASRWTDSYIKCINYQGQEMWKFGKRLQDGSAFRPFNVCTDDKGNVFVNEESEKRIIVIRENLSYQILFNAQGRIMCMDWCCETKKLCVAYVVNEGEDEIFQMALARYDTTNI